MLVNVALRAMGASCSHYFLINGSKAVAAYNEDALPATYTVSFARIEVIDKIITRFPYNSLYNFSYMVKVIRPNGKVGLIIDKTAEICKYDQVDWITPIQSTGIQVIITRLSKTGWSINKIEAYRSKQPYATIDISPKSGIAPLKVTSTFMLMNGSKYRLDWGNGIFAETDRAVGINPIHTYNSPGIYKIVATAMNNDGNISSATQTVVVLPDNNLLINKAINAIKTQLNNTEVKLTSANRTINDLKAFIEDIRAKSKQKDTVIKNFTETLFSVEAQKVKLVNSEYNARIDRNTAQRELRDAIASFEAKKLAIAAQIELDKKAIADAWQKAVDVKQAEISRLNKIITDDMVTDEDKATVAKTTIAKLNQEKANLIAQAKLAQQDLVDKSNRLLGLKQAIDKLQQAIYKINSDNESLRVMIVDNNNIAKNTIDSKDKEILTLKSTLGGNVSELQKQKEELQSKVNSLTTAINKESTQNIAEEAEIKALKSTINGLNLTIVGIKNKADADISSLTIAKNNIEQQCINTKNQATKDMQALVDEKTRIEQSLADTRLTLRGDTAVLMDAKSKIKQQLADVKVKADQDTGGKLLQGLIIGGIIGAVASKKNKK